jgi:3',5'-cyclic AMP phosphodiesterase CpdA
MDEMSRLIHISDLHFGRTNPGILEPLVRKIIELEPRFVAISGDLTQRARTTEFLEAKNFLSKLPYPRIVVPGNHDIPLYNVLARFYKPLSKFRRYITDDLLPFYTDDEMAVLGINTARSLTSKYGRINAKQIGEIRRRFRDVGENLIKVVITHHPFDLPEAADPRDLVGRAELAMASLSECRADLLLAGHMHIALAGRTAQRYKIAGYSAIFVQAGTATSTRGRGEPNSFNLLTLEFPRITIERLAWNASERSFGTCSLERFFRGPHGWERE